MSKDSTKEASGSKRSPLKKQLLKIRLFFLALLVISIVLIAVSEVTMFFGFIGLVAVFVYFPSVKQTKRQYCKACGEKYDYEEDVGFEIEGEESTTTSVRAIVKFECHCKQCGKVHEFTEKLCVANYDAKKGRWNKRDLRTLCKKYFKSFLSK